MWLALGGIKRVGLLSGVTGHAGVRYFRSLKPPKRRMNPGTQKPLKNSDPEESLDISQTSLQILSQNLDQVVPGTYDRNLWSYVTALSRNSLGSSEALKPLLPKLGKTALSLPDKVSRHSAISAVGDLAYKAGVVRDLPVSIYQQYMDNVSVTNPYRAIELWLNQPERWGLSRGIGFYIRAGQLAKAEQMATGPLGPNLIRKFLMAYIRNNDQAGVDKWIDRMQATDPLEVAWLYNSLALNRMDTSKLDHFKTTLDLDDPQVRPSLSPREERLLSRVNQLIVEHPTVLDNADAYKTWMDLLLTVDVNMVHQLIDEIALYEKLSPGDLTPVIKQLTSQQIVDLVLKMDVVETYPNPTCTEWVLAANHLARSQVPEESKQVMAAQISEKMRFHNCLFSTEALAAIFSCQPLNIMNLGFDALQKNIPLHTHHFLAIWRHLQSFPSPDYDEKLLPVLWEATRHSIPSFAVLRAVCQSFLVRGDFLAVCVALYDYQVSLGVQMDPRFIESLHNFINTGKMDSRKFSRPVVSTPNEKAWERDVSFLAQAAEIEFDLDGVRQYIASRSA